MPVNVEYLANVTVAETLDDPSLASNGDKLRHTGFNSTNKLTADTATPVTQVSAFELQLSAGAASIDLTALTGTNGSDVDGTGLKVQIIKFIADGENSDVVTIGDGAADGYELLGDGWTLTLAAGQEFMCYLNESAPDIGAAAKDIDLSSVDVDAKLKCIIVMG